ncbi:MAG: amidohydrolase [Tyzzerella sp.]|nr:amidohydrolase [Lachnospiraceae bacterium]MBP3664489.1 amidohydrolase [Tyzzerella sp.]
MNTETLLSQANEFEQKIIEYRRFLHMHPETGFDLKITKEYVKNELIQMGYEPQECGKCGLIVLVGGRKPGKTFMLRADMDALQIQEQADVEFKSLHEGKMHACGHDMHTAMLLGAARLLKTHESEIKGTVKLMFQPAEETLEGAKDMLEAGVLENPKTDAALMIHVTLGMPLSTGSAIICDGGISAPTADYFEIKIQGKGCHGAMPELGVDPITIASHIVIALQELHARELAMADDAVLTIGTIQAGDANNIIPDTVVLRGTMRAYDENIRKRLKVRLEEISKGIAKTFRGVVDVCFTSGCPTLLNDANISADVTKYCKELLGEDMAFSQSELRSLASSNAKATKAVGSEDFAYISHQVPSIMVALTAGNVENGCPYPLHHPKVIFDEDALAIGSSIYAYSAMRWLEEHS